MPLPHAIGKSHVSTPQAEVGASPATMPAPARPARSPGPRFAEFVVLMAALMSLNAFAIDAMLPALPAIGDALGVTLENRRQLVVTLYLLGFGTTQMIWGPLSDRFGRRPVLVAGLLLYALFALLAALATSFPMLLAARAAQGGAAAATRVLVTSIVRDRFEGATMARVMSLTFMVFMLMPVLAPSFGQAVLLFADWRAIFWGLALWGVGMLAWAWLRLPETLDPANRRPISVRAVGDAAREAMTNRTSLGYTLGVMALMGALMGYVNSVQQIVFDVFERPGALAAVFAGIAVPMAGASWANSHFVERVGVRRMAHWALVAFTATAAAHFVWAATVGDDLIAFVAFQGLIMACFGLATSNMGAIAMGPMGRIAGTASAMQGTVQTIGAAVIGAAIGQSFDGSTVPLTAGFALMGAAALGLVWWTEGGNIFARDREKAV